MGNSLFGENSVPQTRAWVTSHRLVYFLFFFHPFYLSLSLSVTNHGWERRNLTERKKVKTQNYLRWTSKLKKKHKRRFKKSQLGERGEVMDGSLKNEEEESV